MAFLRFSQERSDVGIPLVPSSFRASAHTGVGIQWVEGDCHVGAITSSRNDITGGDCFCGQQKAGNNGNEWQITGGYLCKTHTKIGLKTIDCCDIVVQRYTYFELT